MSQHPVALVTAPSHVAMEVSDLDRSFYAATLGFEIFMDDRQNSDAPSVKGTVADFGIEFAQAKGGAQSDGRRAFGRPLGSPFLSFAVTNIDEAFTALKAMGLVQQAAPDEVGGVKFFYFYDPDGQPIELIQFPSPLRVLADLRTIRR